MRPRPSRAIPHRHRAPAGLRPYAARHLQASAAAPWGAADPVRSFPQVALAAGPEGRAFSSSLGAT